MSDSFNQKISQYLDNELSSTESFQLLQAMQQQPEHQETMQRYMLIKQALKARPALMAEADFSVKLRQQLAQEPTYLLPQKRPKTHAWQKPILALAASFLAVAIIVPVVKKINTAHTTPTLAMVQTYQGSSLRGGMLMTPSNESVAHPYPVNKRFQDYLQAHNGSLYTNGAANFQTRAQLAGYGREE